MESEEEFEEYGDEEEQEDDGDNIFAKTST